MTQRSNGNDDSTSAGPRAGAASPAQPAAALEPWAASSPAGHTTGILALLDHWRSLGHGMSRASVMRLLEEVEQQVSRDPTRAISFDAQGFATLVAAGRRWDAGRFEAVSIAELRARCARVPAGSRGSVRFSLFRGAGAMTDIGALQAAAGPGTLFQVASQFNALEATDPEIVPVAEYPSDGTQGPRASVSAFPGTFLRHYAAPFDRGRGVQGRDGRVLDMLGAALPVEVATVTDGYLLASAVHRPDELEAVLTSNFEAICVGVHEQVEVALGYDWGGLVPTPAPRIAQVFTSTMALGGYSPGAPAAITRACRPLLRAAYLGTILAAIALGQRTVVLTSIGGGAFCNPHQEIHAAIRWALAEADSRATADLDVVLNQRDWREGADELEREVQSRGGLVIEVAEPRRARVR